MIWRDIFHLTVNSLCERILKILLPMRDLHPTYFQNALCKKYNFDKVCNSSSQFFMHFYRKLLIDFFSRMFFLYYTQSYMLVFVAVVYIFLCLKISMIVLCLTVFIQNKEKNKKRKLIRFFKISFSFKLKSFKHN